MAESLAFDEVYAAAPRHDTTVDDVFVTPPTLRRRPGGAGHGNSPPRPEVVFVVIHELQTLRRTAERRAFAALNRVLLPVVSAGVGSPLPVGPGAVVLETTGRVSGLPRRVPLLGVRVGGTVVVSTVRRRSQWVRNLESRPEGRVWLAGRARRARADRPQRRGPLQVVVLRVHEPDEPER